MTGPRPPRRPRSGPSTARSTRSAELTMRARLELLPQLYRLWADYVGSDEPPMLDRWLGRTLSGLDGLSRGKRLWIGAQLTDGVRFAWLALLCDEASTQASGNPLAHVLDGVGTTREAWRRLGGIAPETFFFWVFLRLRADAGKPPRLEEPVHSALKNWHRIREGLERTDSLDARLIWAGLPTAVAPAFEERARLSGWSSDDLRRFVERQTTRPPLWLRLRDGADRKPVYDELRRAGFSVSGDGLAIAAVGDTGIFEMECWRTGRVEIQDLASQAIGRAVAVEKGHFVWDACAGGGGKALQLASLMRGSGAVYATDLREKLLADLRRRAKRAGLNNVRAYPWDGEALPDFGKTISRRGGFDRVLVDTPCSGSGTWRRNPDGRLWADAGDLSGLAKTQGRLLEIAAEGVNPGGMLIYATCSWLAAENEDVVAKFLHDHEDLELIGQGMHGNPHDDADCTFSAILRRPSADASD